MLQLNSNMELWNSVTNLQTTIKRVWNARPIVQWKWFSYNASTAGCDNITLVATAPIVKPSRRIVEKNQKMWLKQLSKSFKKKKKWNFNGSLAIALLNCLLLQRNQISEPAQTKNSLLSICLRLSIGQSCLEWSQWVRCLDHQNNNTICANRFLSIYCSWTTTTSGSSLQHG